MPAAIEGATPSSKRSLQITRGTRPPRPPNTHRRLHRSVIEPRRWSWTRPTPSTSMPSNPWRGRGRATPEQAPDETPCHAQDEAHAEPERGHLPLAPLELALDRREELPGHRLRHALHHSLPHTGNRTPDLRLPVGDDARPAALSNERHEDLTPRPPRAALPFAPQPVAIGRLLVDDLHAAAVAAA